MNKFFKKRYTYKILTFVQDIIRYIQTHFYIKMLKKEFYVLQDRDYGIGNFINCTPTIKTLSDYYSRKIPVYFESDHLSDMFIDCPFIKIINENKSKKMYELFSSALVNETIPDTEYIHSKVTKRLRIKVTQTPHTYVDKKTIPVEYKNKSYIVVIRGGAINSVWIEKKDVGDDIYKYFLNKLKDKYDIVFIGTDIDYERYFNYMKNWIPNCKIELNNIDRSVGLILGAQFVIGNDTGMYHVAGALNKKTYVFWKDSLFPKNKTPGKNTIYSFKNSWFTDFNNWYNNKFQ